MAKVNSINNKAKQLTIDPGVSGDSFLQFNINEASEFKIGVDDSDSDKLKISQGSDLAANTTFVMTAAGERTMPLQPAFLADVTPVTSVTGDGTEYQVTTDSPIFDQSGDWNVNGTFTASVTGLFGLGLSLKMFSDLSGGDEIRIKVVTSNRTYYVHDLPTRNRYTGFYDVNDIIEAVSFIVVDMDESDTAYFTYQTSGGSKLDDLEEFYLFGTLLC